jgi:DNA-binding HxlR family transcriptional regulator
VGELFAMLGQPHMLRILNLLVTNRGTPMRFGAIESQLHLSPKTLAQRLRTLVEAGFLTRRSFNEIPPRVEYEVTPKAIELGELFPVLGRWAEKNTMTAVPTVSVVGRLRGPPLVA